MSLRQRFLPHLANTLTIARPIMATFLMAIVIFASPEVAFSIPIAIAWIPIALTDYFDGKAARRFGGSPIGPTLDERLDKITIDGVFVILVAFGRLNAYLVILMILRDVFATIVRHRARFLPDSPVKSAKLPGRAKTVIQCILIFFALLPMYDWLPVVLFCLTALATIVSIVSGAQIFIVALNAKNNDWLKGVGGNIGLPNWISLFRMATALVVPAIHVAQPFGPNSNLIAFIVLLITAATDVVDGYIARKYHLVSNLGKVLDPICDKCIFYPVLLSLLVATVRTPPAPYLNADFMPLFITIATSIIAARDLGFALFYFLKGRNDAKDYSANGWDKARAVALTIWTASLSIVLFSPTTFFSYLALSAMTAGAILSVKTIQVALELIGPQN